MPFGIVAFEGVPKVGITMEDKAEVDVEQGCVAEDIDFKDQAAKEGFIL